MKLTHIIVPGVLAAAIAVPAAGAPHRFGRYKRGPEHTLRVPATDTTDSRHKFKHSSLLDARGRLALNESQDWTTVATDTAGLLSFARADRDAVLRTLKTNIRARRYAKGKLKMHTNSMADVLVDGQSVIRKENADSAAVDQESPLTLMPEVDYEVQVNLLSLATDPADTEFSLEFVPDNDFEDVTVEMSPDMKRYFEIEDINLGPRVSRVSLSPDGKYLLVAYSRMYDADNTRHWTVLQETASGRVVDSTVPAGAAWMPKGSRLYWTQEMEPGKFDIYVRDVTKGTTALAVQGVPDRHFSWSPDESYGIYYKYENAEAPTGVMRRYEAPDDRLPGYRDRSYLVKYDMKTGVSTPLTYGGGTTVMLDIAPDSRHLVYSVTRDNPEEWPFYHSDIIQIDVNTLQTDTLIRHEASFNNATYSPDGRKLFFIGGPDFMDGLGRNCGSLPIANSFDVQGYIFDIATRQATAVTKDFDPSISGDPKWNAKDGKVYFRAEEGFNYNLFCYDPKTGKTTRLDTAMPTASSMSIGNDEDQWLAYVGHSYTDTGAAFVLNLRTGKTRMVDDPMAGYLADVQFGEITPWTFTAKDGTVIDGRVCLPPDFDAARKYPMIVYYYGGTSPSSEGMGHPYTPQLLASRGYVVYVLNPSGTTGYGQEFSSRHVNAWGDWTADEIIEGVKQMCREHDFVDAKKVGCMGASYGGFMTQLLQTKTDIFAAAVSHAGISNVTSYWGEGYWGYSYNSVAAAKSYPWSDPELFTKHGSLFNADKIHTPLLLLHGTVDTNVPIGESIQLFNALRILGRDVEFITVDGQDHIITDYEKRKLWHATIMAWFAKWLQDSPQWWDSMYGDK